MRIDLGFVWLCALVLVALSMTAFAVDITACGQYGDSNTVYELRNNITTDGSTYGGYCLNMTGYNQTLNGNGYTISSSNITAGSGIKVSLTGVQIYKIGINGFQYGMWLTTTASNTTVYYVKVNGSTQGIRVVSNVSGGWNYFGYNYVRNTTYGLYIANQGSNVFTNCDYNGSTDDINNIGTGTQYDNGFNYWDDCSGAGGCAWYTITGGSATNERSPADAPVNVSAPTTNYGSTAVYGFSSTKVLSYFLWSPAINHASTGMVAPVFTSFKFGVWANILSGVPLLVSYYANQSFSEGTITYNNRPTDTPTQIGGTFQPVLAYTQGWFTASASALNLSAQYYFSAGRYPVVYLTNSTNSANVLSIVFDENASGRPALNYTWHAANPNLNGTYSATQYVMALDGAGYCSIIYPTSSDPPVITDYWTGATQTLMYTGTANSTRNWTAWACSEGSIYQVNFTDPRPIITSATCDPQTSTMIANFTFYDEDTGASTAVNITAYATGTTNLGTFDTTTTVGATNILYVCKPNWVSTMTATFELDYLNATANQRTYYLDATETTNTNISAYTVNNTATGSSNINFIVKNEYGAELDGYRLQMLRYYPATTAYKLVDMETTDADGTAPSMLFTNLGVYYKIYAFKDGDLIKTFSSELVSCLSAGSCEHNLYIESDYDEPAWWQEYGNVSWNCSWDNVNTTTCNWADSTGVAHTYNITTKKISATGITQVCSSQNYTASSGSLSCVITGNTTGGIYTMTFTRQSDLRVLDKRTYDFSGREYETIGALFAFLIIVAVGLVGITVPNVAPFMFVLGLVIAKWAGFISIEIGAVACLVFASLIIIWKQGGN